MPQTSPINAHTLDLTLDHPMNGCYGHPSAAGGCLRLLSCNANHTINNNRVHTAKHPINTASSFKFTFHAPTHPNVSLFLRQHRNCGQSSSSNIKSNGLELGGPASHRLFVNRIARNKMTICISHNTFPRDNHGISMHGASGCSDDVIAQRGSRSGRLATAYLHKSDTCIAQIKTRSC